MLLAMQEHKNVEGAEALLVLFATFAAAQGWTIDHQNATQLQIFSNGWGSQKMIYRIAVSSYDTETDWWKWKAVHNANRLDAFSLTGWGPNTTTSTAHSEIGIPKQATDIYFFGNDKFLGVILHAIPTSVITFAYGTINLFDGWKDYDDGLFFAWWLVTTSFQATGRWTNMTNETWNHPVTSIGDIRLIWYGGESRVGSIWVASNFQISSATTTESATITGQWTNKTKFLQFNPYSSRRSAFYSTFFIKDLTQNLWYPLGLSPVAWIHGYGLRIGEELTLGDQVYKVFPQRDFNNMIWQAYRIE